MNRVSLKNKAKEMVKGNRWELLKPLMVIWLLEVVVSTIASTAGGSTLDNPSPLELGTTSLLAIALIPASIGYISYILKFTRGKKLDVKEELLGKYKYFGPVIMTAILVGVFISLWTILLIIPGIIAALSYSMVNYILADEDNEKIEPLDVIRRSKEMMSGHKMEYFILTLSFIGWIILGIFTLGILYIWLIPYMQVTFALYYEELKKTSVTKIK